MVLKLKKGEEANVTQEDPTLRQVSVGLGWDVAQSDDEFALDANAEKVDYDLDTSAFLLTSDKMIRDENDFIFYNNPKMSDDSVIHQGDNKTGEGEGDDEVIRVNLDKMSFDVHHIVFAVSIHNAVERHHTFGTVQNAFMRIVNEETGQEIARYDLTEKFGDETAVLFGELYRIGSEWVFIAHGTGVKGGLAEIARSYDVNVKDE